MPLNCVRLDNKSREFSGAKDGVDLRADTRTQRGKQFPL